MPILYFLQTLANLLEAVGRVRDQSLYPLTYALRLSFRAQLGYLFH